MSNDPGENRTAPASTNPPGDDDLKRAADPPCDGQVDRHAYRPIKYNWFVRLLLTLSRTDRYVLHFCTEETRTLQISMGGMVLITGIFAFVSALFMAYSVFFDKPPSLQAWTLGFLGAAFYAVTIMAFDREVVSATSFWSAVARVPFAIVIGIVIAIPMELTLYGNAIQQEYERMVAERFDDKLQEAQRLQLRLEAEMEQFIGDARKRKEQAEAELEAAAKRYNDEVYGKISGKSGKGIKATAFLEEKQAVENTYNETVAELDRKLAESTQRFAPDKAAIERLRNEVEQKSSAKPDILDRMRAFFSILRSDAYVYWSALFISIFFMGIELFPVAIKAARPYSEYNAYIDARRRLNVTKIVSTTNYFLDKMHEHPSQIKDMRQEITDFFEQIMEDPHHEWYRAHHENDASTQGRFAWLWPGILLLAVPIALVLLVWLLQ